MGIEIIGAPAGKQFRSKEPTLMALNRKSALSHIFCARFLFHFLYISLSFPIFSNGYKYVSDWDLGHVPQQLHHCFPYNQTITSSSQIAFPVGPNFMNELSVPAVYPG